MRRTPAFRRQQLPAIFGMLGGSRRPHVPWSGGGGVTNSQRRAQNATRRYMASRQPATINAGNARMNRGIVYEVFANQHGVSYKAHRNGAPYPVGNMYMPHRHV